MPSTLSYTRQPPRHSGLSEMSFAAKECKVEENLTTPPLFTISPMRLTVGEAETLAHPSHIPRESAICEAHG